MITPEVRIKSSFLLNNKIIPLLLPGLEESGQAHMADKDYINTKVDEYQQAWKDRGDIILRAMCEVLDLEFNQNIIDAYVLPFGNSFSDPMVISTKYSPERFVDVFTHELAHRLLTDNNKIDLNKGDKLLPYWKELFGDEHSFVTLVHIPVHALLEYIFMDILEEPERLRVDMESRKQSVEYDLAWQYVKAHGYKRIIKQLREQYKRGEE